MGSIMAREVWKSIVGFPDYQVSSLGRVRSVTLRRGSRASVKNGIIKGWIKLGSSGRPVASMISLRLDHQTFGFRIHRLVLGAFVGPCPEGMEACHNDGNPLNNEVGNLRWDTHAANIADSVRHGTKTDPPIHIGEAHHKTKITEADVRAIRATPLRRGTRKFLARQYGLNPNTISRILDGRSWSHVPWAQ